MDLKQALKMHFGYDAFRPLQEEIIRDVLAGRDVFALMPTGGGKSICFQLPALLRDGITIVVSPLISLMKDQVDALTAGGIRATFLNSTLQAEEARTRLRGLHRGDYRLLYVAPERLMLNSFLERALNWNIAQIAIDEAHCISEWGHDFRPEYRELRKLRRHFLDVPVMAVTATATERVRKDVVKQLNLREPCCHVASFNRPNLTYRVVPKSSGHEQLLEIVRSSPNDSGIVYCASRKTADRLAAELKAQGITAKPYHAGLDPADRARHHDLFLRDDVRVITATIAFGMGINKPNVRFIVHYDLPKNLESYYQETGRAGRDGLPAECVLLFNPGDAVKQRHFIEQKSNVEQRIAHDQLRAMISYAETRHCRRATLLSYFGERLTTGSCGGCDNCLSPRETFDGTIAAQKFLSCVHRVYAKEGFGFGLNHIVDVLTGGNTEQIRQRGHDQLSTFGVGREFSRTKWQSIGRELLRLGLVNAAHGKFATLQITRIGLTALRERSPITLTIPPDIERLSSSKPRKTRPRGKAERIGMSSGIDNEPASMEEALARTRDGRTANLRDNPDADVPYDEELFAKLKLIRRELARQRDVRAFVIFSDNSLREMARTYPTTPAEFSRIPGVGQQKLRAFAEPFTAAIGDHLATA